MSDLDRIVNVSIELQSGGITTKNFSTIMFLSKTATNVYKEYASTKEILDDGYTDTSDEYLSAQSCFSQAIKPPLFAIGQHDSVGGDSITVALSAINAVSDKWYGLVIGDISVEADIVSAGTWAKDNKKRLFTVTNDVDALVTGDVTSIVYQLNNGGVIADVTYNAVARNSTVQGFIDVAVATYHLVRTPGSYSPAYKTLTSCTPDALTGSQVGALIAGQCNMYHEIAGENRMEQGLSTGSVKEYTGTYIGIDWLYARIQEAEFTALSNIPKISYTNKDAAILDAELSAVLQTAVENKFLASFKTTAEDTADQSVSDRAGRIYNGLSFTSTLAGAIHYVGISGTVGK